MQIVVQIVLVLAVVVLSLALMRGGSNAQHLAIRRLMLILFALVAAFSIFFPTVLTHVARFLGIGRGTDLVLYGLIVTVLVFMATTYQRFRNMEASITRLSRRIALDEAILPVTAVDADVEGAKMAQESPDKNTQHEV
ncbi:hypothetical protein QO003_001373 [Arthrobacter silviterrae]|uniref:DUF2304 domain-containing protein n=1 Tax=Arthrobacter silviterrae TaxID=2026658 RepID=A0ABX0DHW0_9MICC|nr:DUF2304 domain-containing protein [Arthrobacter silviterrae]MDQ0277070.1 hypothetical protein [Arthrobacter silviterrae]NGN83883.1 DUF2304 domain-containing protein [Arthrobacter silviterrae]